MPDLETITMPNGTTYNLRDSRFGSVQTQGNWKWKEYGDNTFEAWYKATGQTLTITTTSGNLYRSDLQTMTLPTNFTNAHMATIIDCSVNAAHNNYPVWGLLASIQPSGYANAFRWYAMSGGSRNSNSNYYITAYVFGTYS